MSVGFSVEVVAWDELLSFVNLPVVLMMIATMEFWICIS